MMINKKAQIGATMTWFIAFIIIFFLMIIFVAITVGLAPKKLLEKGEIKIVEGETLGDLKVQRSLMAFLNYPVEVNGEEKTVYDLLGSSSLDSGSDSDFFEKQAEDFFLNYFSEASWKGGVNPWWIRVQSFGEDLEKPKTTSKFHAGAFNCDPKEDIISQIYIEDKQIVFCVLKTYDLK